VRTSCFAESRSVAPVRRPERLLAHAQPIGGMYRGASIARAPPRRQWLVRSPYIQNRGFIERTQGSQERIIEFEKVAPRRMLAGRNAASGRESLVGDWPRTLENAVGAVQRSPNRSLEFVVTARIESSVNSLSPICHLFVVLALQPNRTAYWLCALSTGTCLPNAELSNSSRPTRLRGVV
jgi:hypothetical protein